MNTHNRFSSRNKKNIMWIPLLSIAMQESKQPVIVLYNSLNKKVIKQQSHIKHSKN